MCFVNIFNNKAINHICVYVEYTAYAALAKCLLLGGERENHEKKKLKCTVIIHTFLSFHKMLAFSLFTEIGVGLAGFGVAFLFLGVLLLFDKGLLAIGNVSTITGCTS